MKICIIGAGSTYTPELIEGVINKEIHFLLLQLILWILMKENLTLLVDYAKE